ncbi:MAG: hypothetical protein V3W18_14355 [candidate division Zixibacteria bacterium]
MIVLGNQNLLHTKSAVVLNSSQSKTPCGNDPWMRVTSGAIANLIESGYTIITSLGLNTWELSVFLVSRHSGKQIIISPETDDNEGRSIFNETIRDFNLDPDNFAMVFVKPENNSRRPKSNWAARDKAAISLAESIVPVSIRPNGKLQRLINDSSEQKQITTKFNIEHHKSLVSPPRYSKENISFDTEKWDYLTHWTRTCHGPWPGQSKYEYYDSLLKSGSEYPNNAFETLKNISAELTIRASSKRIREGKHVIGFTESVPKEVISRLRWLPKRTGWNFEPYGIAIRKKTAIKLGIKPVFYGNSDDYSAMPEEMRPYFQSMGEKDVDWSEEKEWRRLGDLDLSNLPSEDLLFLVWRDDEADFLRGIVANEVSGLSGTQAKSGG